MSFIPFIALSRVTDYFRSVFFLARQPELASSLKDSSDALKVLIKGCTSFKVVEAEDDIPVGCVTESVSSGLAVFLLLKVSLSSAMRSSPVLGVV